MTGESLERVIIFFDMDCFYCQVETRRLGLGRDVPLVVDQWGMLLSVNYAAKALGVSRKTLAKEARELGCVVPHVALIDLATGEEVNDVSVHGYRDRTMYKAKLDRYRDASEEVMTVVQSSLPKCSVFERASVDECYADVLVSDLEELFPTYSKEHVESLRWENDSCGDINDKRNQSLIRAALLGERVRSEILAVTQFTVSCGVSVTRQVAKLSCSLNKPDKLTVVSAERTSEFMKTVPLKEIRGLGPRAMETLQSRLPWVSGTTLCGALWDETAHIGQDEFGKWLYEALRGLNDSPIKETGVQPGSAQASKQFRPPLEFLETESMLVSLCGEMLSRLKGRGIDLASVSSAPKTLVVTLVSGTITRSRQVPWPVEERDVVSAAISLAYKTGLMTGAHSFDRIAVSAKDLAAEESSSDQPQNTTTIQNAKNHVNEYLSASRLHFMGTWRNRYLRYVSEVEESLDWKEGSFDVSLVRSIEENDIVMNQHDETNFRDFTNPSCPTYLFVDMDCFFVSVAVLLSGGDSSAPAAVASGLGPTSEICSANYAARKFGVHSSSFVQTAKEKCERIVIFPVSAELLKECETVWKKVIHVLWFVVKGDFGRLFGKSCDEAFVRLKIGGTESPLSEPLVELAKCVQQCVFEVSGVPCSVGVAPSRILAKMATSLAKPRGVKIINSMAEGAELVARFPSVASLPGVGYSTRVKLREVCGIESVAELLAEFHSDNGTRLTALLGQSTCTNIINTAKGIDNEEEFAKEFISTVSAEKNFGFRDLSFQQAADVVVALAGSVIDRLPGRCVIEKVVLKLKMAPDDWVEPTKKGGIGDVYDYSRTAPFGRTEPVTETAIAKNLIPFLKDVDSMRIRGIGVSAKLAQLDGKKNKRNSTNGQDTLDDFFSGKRNNRVAVGKINGASSVPKEDYTSDWRHNVPQSLLITAPCVVCGERIPFGSLVLHFLGHTKSEEICPCPVCKEPIELSDNIHVASHFT